MTFISPWPSQTSSFSDSDDDGVTISVKTHHDVPRASTATTTSSSSSGDLSLDLKVTSEAIDVFAEVLGSPPRVTPQHLLIHETPDGHRRLRKAMAGLDLSRGRQHQVRSKVKSSVPR